MPVPIGRRASVRRVAERAQREKADECGLAEIGGQGLQSTLRRGWCYGSATFKERLLELADEVLRSRSARRDRSKNYRGAELSDHGERRAEKIVSAGLEEFELGGKRSELDEMRKRADEKALIAATRQHLEDRALRRAKRNINAKISS